MADRSDRRRDSYSRDNDRNSRDERREYKRDDRRDRDDDREKDRRNVGRDSRRDGDDNNNERGRRESRWGGEGRGNDRDGRGGGQGRNERGGRSDRGRGRERERERERGGGDERWGSRNQEQEKSPSSGGEKDEDVVKEKPNFVPSGKLAEETNTFRGVVLKYSEPTEARKPTERWRLYVFKGSEQIDLYYMHRQSAYLFGRERLVADVPIDHPSCSKQHAVLQYRYTEITNDLGDVERTIKPYLIDLASSNGTKINGEKIEAQRYYELKEKDCINFGDSTRDYVFLHEHSNE